MAGAVPSASSPKRLARWFFLAWVVPVLLAITPRHLSEADALQLVYCYGFTEK